MNNINIRQFIVYSLQKNKLYPINLSGMTCSITLFQRNLISCLSLLRIDQISIYLCRGNILMC